MNCYSRSRIKGYEKRFSNSSKDCNEGLQQAVASRDQTNNFEPWNRKYWGTSSFFHRTTRCSSNEWINAFNCNLINIQSSEPRTTVQHKKSSHEFNVSKITKTFSPQTTSPSVRGEKYFYVSTFFLSITFRVLASSSSDKTMIKKRLTSTSDDESDKDEDPPLRSAKTRRKRFSKQLILTKILNRSSSGFFNQSIHNKSNQTTFSNEPALKFCLKDIIPYRNLNDHIFMGLSSCGNFLISYRRICCESESSINYDFNSGYKYQLYFWIYRPHFPLNKYVSGLRTILNFPQGNLKSF